MEENKNNTQYKTVFKATALFGGVQVLQILIGIIRSKLVAVILGPSGMGISGLYTSSTELIKSCTSFGLSASAVKFIAEANGEGNNQKLSRVVAVFGKLMLVTGLLGMLAVIVFSPLLSKSAFGNYDFTIPFIVLSVTLLLFQLSAGKLSILQGTRNLRSLAQASLIGSVIGLFTTIPLYYIWGTQGIVPALVIAALTGYLLNWYYARKIKISVVVVSFKEAFDEGRGMINLGVAMTLSGILATAVAYIIRVFVSNRGGTGEVGLYTAGVTILTTYVGMIFSAMATDYFPRLSASCNDKNKSKELVNQQAEIALLILGPILALFIILAPLIIIILYSSAFLPTVKYMQWAAVGMLFRAISWAISFLFLAKSDTKVFIFNEIAANIVTLITSILGYSIWGLEGLGIAFLASYILYFVMVWGICAKKYSYSISSQLYHIMIIHMILTIGVFVFTFQNDVLVKYVPAISITIISCLYSFRELDKRIGIRMYIINLIHNHKS